MLTKPGHVRFGNCNNVQVKFDILHIPDEEMDCLEISICSGDNQDFDCKMTLNAVTPEVIDKLCEQLSSLKDRLKPAQTIKCYCWACGNEVALEAIVCSCGSKCRSDV